MAAIRVALIEIRAMACYKGRADLGETMPSKTKLPKNSLAALRLRNFRQLLLARLWARRSRGARPITQQICIIQFKNEQDILEPFLRHHSPLFDAVIVMNNGSTDRSGEIVALLAQELGNIITLDVPINKNVTSRSISHMLRQAQSAFFADFVFFLDADEFIHTTSRAAFDAAIAAVPAGQGGRMAWRTFVPNPKLDEDDILDPILRLTLRRKSEVLRYVTSKMFLRLGGTFDPAIATEEGSHKQRTGLNLRVKARVLQGLPLLHLPLRSREQARAKGMVGWAGITARNDPSLGGGAHWEKLNNDFAARKAGISNHDLANMAMTYGTRYPIGDFASNTMPDDHGLPHLRRYSDGRYAQAEALIAATKSPRPMYSQGFTSDLFIDAPPLQFLMTRFAPQTVLDFGGASGGYGDLCAFHGAKQVTYNAEKDQRFDMVLNFGGLDAYDAITRHAKEAIIALPSTDMSSELTEWAARGWYPDLIATLGARACATEADLHRHLLVLRPVLVQGAADQLCKIAAYPHHTYPQDARLRLSVFEDPFPDLNQGYGLRLR